MVIVDVMLGLMVVAASDENTMEGEEAEEVEELAMELATLVVLVVALVVEADAEDDDTLETEVADEKALDADVEM